MAKATIGETAGPTPVEKLLPQLVAEALDRAAQAAAYERLKDLVGEDVTYYAMLSAPHHGILVELTPRVALVRWDDGTISRAPFMSRLEAKQ